MIDDRVVPSGKPGPSLPRPPSFPELYLQCKGLNYNSPGCDQKQPIQIIIVLSSTKLLNICQFNRCMATQCLLFFNMCSTASSIQQEDLKSPSAALCLMHSFSLVSSLKKEEKKPHPIPSKQITEHLQINLLAAFLLDIHQAQNMQGVLIEFEGDMTRKVVL